jgi:Transposase IS116/IS110/IS902 family
VLIARLTAQLRCYAPEPVDETWGRLRHLGARREQLLTSIVSEIQQIRALLECVWPAALETAQQPFRSKTWTAAMHIVCDRDGGDLARTRRLGAARFEQAVRREIVKRGGHKPCGRIVRKLFAALADPAGVLAHRRGGLERVQLLLGDWVEDQRRLADTEARMLAVLDELQLTELVTSIDGVSPVGAAAVLAETGDPRRFITARAVVKHAGLAPREKLSGTYVGAPSSPAKADPDYGWPPGEWSGPCCTPTPSTPPATGTSPAASTTSSPPPRRRPSSPRRCCASCTPSSSPAVPGTRPSRGTAPGESKKHPTLPDDSLRRTSGRTGRALRGIETQRARRSPWAASPVVTPTRLHAAGTNPIAAMQGHTTDEATDQNA